MKHETYNLHSSHGELTVNKYGAVILCDYSPECCAEDEPDGKCYIANIVAVDLQPYIQQVGDHKDIDVLDVDLILKGGGIDERVESHFENAVFFAKNAYYPWEKRPDYLQDCGDITLDLRYWDCACDGSEYFHPVSEEKCDECGALQEDMPSSRANEVNEWLAAKQEVANA